MEGTRHEKVALVAIAYLIGFITAFIAFGVNKIHTGSETLVIRHDTSNAEIQTEAHNAITSVGLDEEGLFAVTSQRERLLSADRDILNASVISSTGEPGFYYSIIDAEASRNGQFAYFCEQLLEEAAECDPYVYELATDMLHPVRMDGELFKPNSNEHTSLWTEDSLLMLNGAVSSDPAQPWNLTSTVQ